MMHNCKTMSVGNLTKQRASDERLINHSLSNIDMVVLFTIMSMCTCKYSVYVVNTKHARTVTYNVCV